MEIKVHDINNSQIAEIISGEIFIQNEQDGLDFMGNIYYQGFEKLIIYKHNITNDFFDLKNGMAGEILQKFSNYRIRLAIVGDFSEFDSKSLKDFIYESNQGKQINFLDSVSEALNKLA